MSAPTKKPSCRERAHIPPKYFALWDFAHAVCIANGKNTFLVYPTRAALLICSEPRSVRRAATWLVKHGWFEVAREPEQGYNGAGEYRVLNHDQWIRKHGQRRKESACIYIDPDAPDG